MPAFFMKEYLEVTIQTNDKEKIDLLSALLHDVGFQGFEETEVGLKAYGEKGLIALDEMEAILKNLHLSHSVSILSDQNWNSSWESNFEPVFISNKIHVKADFHPHVAGFEFCIEITPKMSFGTGHHATTRMMMQEMLDLSFNEKTVFDFGTGTGVLAILAEKLGAKKVVAIDNDEWSIENAMENFQRNNTHNISISLSNVLIQDEPFDILLANINKNVLIEHVQSMYAMLKNNGALLISGLLSEDYDDIVTFFTPLFGKVVSQKQDHNWICLRFHKGT
jgi:ribosomal protein L11 methyltransferase